ncbi:IS30 family transposase [Branchiibius sp. NY16-3462-2]|uniref:IS30 family transposase n=1 Tax=Branchiibius sp. NY16-3462-2 TaxID=1807500 RepID=UPI0025B83280|nr:IS30 family transposase [Branchiibius sp. NY16-3462-2]
MAPLPLSEPSGRFLSMLEREQIAAGVARGDSIRAIARRIDRAPSTVLRELRRNRGASPHYRPRRITRPPRRAATYSPSIAQARADRRLARPKATKLESCHRLKVEVYRRLRLGHSPQQIRARLRRDFPDDEQMRISHEAIYRCIYVQGRGQLRQELAACLRTGRAVRVPRARAKRRNAEAGKQITGMVMITERPAEVEDRAVPGHWEGDLIIGKNGESQIGTLVERTTRFVILLHLPGRRDAATVADQMITQMSRLPEHLRRSVTWDQGREMAAHARVKAELDLRDGVYFCDPHSPWQRGTNENTNGLLRQYFPKGSDLSGYAQHYLEYVADLLNTRPRQTLEWATPAEALHQILSTPPETDGVATTA